MNLFEQLLNKNENLSVIGLGYVGMPLAIAFANKVNVIGFDVNRDKVNQYINGYDPTKEVGDDAVKNTTVHFTNDEKLIKSAKFHIIAVPTPVNSDNTPDLYPVESASRIVGRNLVKGSIVVYESTVYPGVTEDICVPILEKESGLKYGVDFKVGYSPERINPGDKVHRLETIIKIVSGMDEESLNIIADVYSLIIQAGVYKAESIKVAEAAKVIENSQRDVNIAFMNELSMIFNRLGIDTQAVLRAAGTKWNFLKFAPGLVGGHCIGIDPYYLTYRADQFGYHSKLILAGRRINDNMGKYIVEETIKRLIHENILIKDSKIGILGITFKEDCPDVRNSKVYDIINELKEYGITPIVYDPVADVEDTNKLYNQNLVSIDEFKNLDCLIIAVAHKEFKSLDIDKIKSMFRNDKISRNVLIDIKGIKNRKEYEINDINYWSL